jgi:hypothetical protein
VFVGSRIHISAIPIVSKNMMTPTLGEALKDEDDEKLLQFDARFEFE